MSKVYLNEKLVDGQDAKISIGDAGFLYGAGLFETMRAQHGTVFCLRDHLDRFLFSVAKLGFNLAHDRASLSAAIDAVLQANEFPEARLRLTLSAVSVSDTSDEPVPTLLVTATKLTPYPEAY